MRPAIVRLMPGSPYSPSPTWRAADWPQRARSAALALTGVDMAALADSDVDIELLSDIAQILDACDAFAPTAEQLKNNKLHCGRGAGGAQRRNDGQDGAQPPAAPRGRIGRRADNERARDIRREEMADVGQGQAYAPASTGEASESLRRRLAAVA